MHASSRQHHPVATDPIGREPYNKASAAVTAAELPEMLVWQGQHVSKLLGYINAACCRYCTRAYRMLASHSQCSSAHTIRSGSTCVLHEHLWLLAPSF